jgi:hypothetical protein
MVRETAQATSRLVGILAVTPARTPKTMGSASAERRQPTTAARVAVKVRRRR